MSFFSIMVAVLTVFVGLVSINTTYLDREMPKKARYASAEVGLYRAFALATQQYVNANATYAGTITWPMLAASTTTPDSMRNVQVNDTWKAIADGAGNFVLCAQMDESAVAALGQMMPSSATPIRTTINGQDFVWLGDPTQAASAAQCH